MALSIDENGETIREPRKCRHCGSNNLDYSWDVPHEPLELYCLDCSKPQGFEIIHPDLTRNSSFNKE